LSTLFKFSLAPFYFFKRVGLDAKFTLRREKLTEVCAELKSKLVAFLSRVVEMSGVAAGDISTVEMVGGGSRMPLVQSVARELVDEKEGAPKLSFTLDIGNAISSGAALAGARAYFSTTSAADTQSPSAESASSLNEAPEKDDNVVSHLLLFSHEPCRHIFEHCAVKAGASQFA
jgi:molecular chaperone DnaK (HSP70)